MKKIVSIDELASFLEKTKLLFLTKEEFEEAFTIHRDATNAISSIEAKSGLWTNSYISALGQNAESGSGGVGGSNVSWDNSGVDVSKFRGLVVEDSERVILVTADGYNVLDGKISDIESNMTELATINFVNSSIATNTATFQGTFDSISALPTEGCNANDYAFVSETDSLGNKYYNRYKWTEELNDEGSHWNFEYRLNNSSFTDVQWKAINSKVDEDWKDGVDDALDSKVDTITASGNLTATKTGTSYAIGVDSGYVIPTEEEVNGIGVNTQRIGAIESTLGGKEDTANKIDNWEKITVNANAYPLASLVKAGLDTKQNAESGKGLSTNDFNNTYKGKLDGLDDALNAKADKTEIGNGEVTINHNGEKVKAFNLNDNANTNIDITTKNVVSSSSVVASDDSPTNLTNGNVRINLIANGDIASSHGIKGSGKTQVTFDATEKNIEISSTWRGIQNNLTSTSENDSLSAKQGKILNENKVDKSVLTQKGDIIYASASSTPTRLGIGSNGQVLKVSNGVPSWQNDNNTTYSAGEGLTLNSDNSFVLNKASGTVLGGVKIGNNINVNNGVISIPNKESLSITVNGEKTVYNTSAQKSVIINKTTLGLGNVDNTSDANKPISTATQDALDAVNAKIDNMFEWSDGAIKAKAGLFTDSFISAKGLNPNSTSPVGGGSDVSWGAESDNIVPLEVEGVTKNLVLESGYGVLDGKINTKADKSYVDDGLESKQGKITERSKLDFNLIENVPDFVKGVTSSVVGLSASPVDVDGNVTLSLDNNCVIPTSTDITQIQTNKVAIQRLSDDKEDKTTVARLQGDFDTFVAGFNSMFQKEGDNIKVLGGLYTDSFISAKGYNENSSAPVGGSDAEWGNASEFGIDLSVNGVSHTLLLEGAYSDLQGKIDLKANAGDVYTTGEIDDKLDEKQNLINPKNKLPYSLVSGTPDLSVKEDKSNRITDWNNAVDGKYPDASLVKNSLEQKANSSAVESLNTRVSNLEGLPNRVSSLEGGYTSLETRVDSLESGITNKADNSRVATLESKLDSMFEKNADGSIRVLGGLYTDSFISAKSSGGDAGVNQDVEEMVDTKIQQLEASMEEMMSSKIAVAITTALTTPV